MAQLRKRVPSRMTLSPRVAQNPPRIAPSGKPIKRKSNGPFGGLNLREARIRGVPERRSQAAEKRSSGWKGKEDQPRGVKIDRFRALKMQRALAPVSYGYRTSVKERISQIESFNDFALQPIVKDSIAPQALIGMEDIIPTPIQRLAIPALLGSDGRSRRSRKKTIIGPAKTNTTMEEFLLAAETGSGKTLAYLLPTIDAIKRAEAVDPDIAAHKIALEEEKQRQYALGLQSPPLSNQPHPTTGRPRAIILLPTSELVAQVGALTKSLSHTIKFRSALISSAYSGRVIRNRLFDPSGIDILISTPHLLASIAESDPNILGRVTHLVIDEADSLLDRSFTPLTAAIIDRATPSLHQLVLCSATIPRSLDSFLRKRFPDIRRLTTPNLHAIPRRVQLGVVDVEKDPYHGNKSLACADSIWTIGKAAEEHAVSHGEVHKDKNLDMKHIIVFVNEREKAVEVADYLKSKGINAEALSRDTPSQRQSEILTAFTSPASPIPKSTDNSPAVVVTPPEPEPSLATYVPLNRRSTPPPRRSLPNTRVLVMTDLGSRGIDTLAVRHVILYDVPHSTIDFIHRLGRTGRMGRRGRGIVLVGKGDRRDVVREVREGMFKGQALV
ncbi:RNA helicase [Glutinoglossum americanum]|uniref:RNA helicase n=1 Tax=Glutinoglossum americanum TaxID=1670608 RepID=A0A9P8KYP7_9PEZI|nr:RNA helicase [Glutinoglossum americanum]